MISVCVGLSFPGEFKRIIWQRFGQSSTAMRGHLRKNIHFWEINISTKTAEFDIHFLNLWICAVNEEILKNVINMYADSRYLWMRWPVNVFQFPKRPFITSCHIPKCILIWSFSFQHESFVHGVAACGASLCFIYVCNILISESSNGSIFIKQHFKLK